MVEEKVVTAQDSPDGDELEKPSPSAAAGEPQPGDQNPANEHESNPEPATSSAPQVEGADSAAAGDKQEQDAEQDAENTGEEPQEAEADEQAKEETPEEDDRMKWYVVKVQSGREEAIKEAIERRVKIEGLEEYFGQILIPMDKEIVKVKGKRKERMRKRFPGYIMAKVDFNDRILYLFRETSGVGDFVGGGLNQPPQPMSPQEVARMTGGLEGERPRREGEVEPSPFHLGDRVKIKDGVFSGLEGEVKEILEDKGQVRVETMVLGRPVPVELEYWQVEAV